MTAKDDGGPAFPQGKSETVGAISVTDIQGGMTLRDWFAGQALAGMMANCDTTGLNAWPAVYAAKYAFEVADAMFAARQGGDA